MLLITDYWLLITDSMEELIKTFHIDYKLILAQLVNFIVVLFVFKKFAYGPIVKMLNERSDKIEKGLKEAGEAAQKLSQAEDIKSEIISQAKNEAHEIMGKAEKSAEIFKNEIIQESKIRAEKILKNASLSIREEKRQILSEIKQEVSDLVVLGMSKLFDEKGDVGALEDNSVEKITSNKH